MAETAAPVRGTRPEGASTEAEASGKVREMFARIAPRYDLLNHLLSWQMDRVWRARTAKRFAAILQRGDARVLDLCCGTGDLALVLSRGARAQIIGADFAHPMLLRAVEKSSSQLARLSPTGAQHSVEAADSGAPLQVAASSGRTTSGTIPGRPLRFLEGDALRLPFADSCFDLVTTAFGFRNLANYEAGLREIRRVLKPGGTLAILEFTEPPDNVLGCVYRLYFRRVLPQVGGIISGDRAAYSYLPKSVSRFFQPQELAALFEAAGYGSVRYAAWTFGTVALHTGVRV